MKDRLAELQKNMAAEAGDGSKETDAFIEISKSPAPATMAEFFEEVSAIRENLDEIEKVTKNLQLIYRTINESTQPSQMLKSQAEDAGQTANFIAMKTAKQIKGLSSKLPDPLSSHCVRILSVQESTLSLRLKRVMEALFQVQQRQRERCKTVLKRNMEVVSESRGSGHFTDEALEQALEQNISLFTDNYAGDSAEIKRQLRDIESRHEELLQLEKNIAEVHELFTTIAWMVQSQGALIDNIESHVTKTADAVVQGRKELAEAETKKTSHRKKKIFCGVTTAVILIIVLVVLIYFVP